MIITVATEAEKKALVPEKYWDKVVITGIGAFNTLMSLKYKIDDTDEGPYYPPFVLNIGYAGSKDIPIGTVCVVESCEAYQEHDLPLGIMPLYELKNDKVPSYKCYTATDFIESSNKEGPFLVDMELLLHSILKCPVLSIKVVSDNMSFDGYKEALKDNYQEEVEKVLNLLGVVVE